MQELESAERLEEGIQKQPDRGAQKGSRMYTLDIKAQKGITALNTNILEREGATLEINTWANSLFYLTATNGMN